MQNFLVSNRMHYGELENREWLSVIVTDNRPISIFKIQPKTIDLNSNLRGMTTGFVEFIHQSLTLKSVGLG